MRNSRDIPPPGLFRATLSVAGILLSLVSIVAEAGLIRRGGVTFSSAPTQPGTAVYMLPMNLFPDGSSTPEEQMIDSDALVGAYRFSFTEGDGEPFQAHHNWGEYCGEIGFDVETPGSLPGCYFTLGREETLSWGGHAVGVPQLNPGAAVGAAADKPAVPGFSYAWNIAGLDEPGATQRITDAALGVYLTYEEAFQSDPEAYIDTEGCFVTNKDYDEGGCQFFSVGGEGSVTGQSLIDLLGTTAFELSLAVSYTAPAGYGFYSAADVLGETEDPIFFYGAEPWTEMVSASRPMRIVIHDVPVSGAMPLVAAGILALGIVGRPRRRRASVREQHG